MADSLDNQPVNDKKPPRREGAFVVSILLYHPKIPPWRGEQGEELLDDLGILDDHIVFVPRAEVLVFLQSAADGYDLPLGRLGL